jgi:DNA-binding winged helix-turn-helix (wHTH) protein
MTTRFGPFTVDVETRRLSNHHAEVHLSPKAFELLVALLDERPRVLSKRELQRRLWPDTFVVEANLSNLIAEVRAALGDQAREPVFIRTAHGYGYGFCADATTEAAGAASGPAALACWLEWGRQRFALGAGEHIIGRAAGVDVRLDATTVSRRHARLTVAATSARLEDLGSKNGTFRGADRLVAPIHLADGDVVRIGSLVLTVRVDGASATTDTAIRP